MRQEGVREREEQEKLPGVKTQGVVTGQWTRRPRTLNAMRAAGVSSPHRRPRVMPSRGDEPLGNALWTWCAWTLLGTENKRLLFIGGERKEGCSDDVCNLTRLTQVLTLCMKSKNSGAAANWLFTSWQKNTRQRNTSLNPNATSGRRCQMWDNRIY